MTVLNARWFDGVDDFLEMNVGAAAISAPVTMAMVTKSLGTGAAWDGLLTGVSSIGNYFYIATHASDRLEYWQNDTTGAEDGPTLPVDEWTLVGLTKASGSVVPRFHRFAYNTSTWTHADSATAVANPTAQTKWYISSNVTPYPGYIAAVAVWDQVLSDAEFEGMASNWPAWLALAPSAAWPLNQASETTAVPDDTGGGATQQTRTGTTVVSEDIPGFSFEAPVVTIEPDYSLFPKAKLRRAVL